MTHTPGPWALREPESDELWEVYAESGGELISYPVYTPNQRANLTLIAAAPELLAVLTWCADRWDKYDEDDAPELGQAIRDAIAKAEGRE
jgi:hypothetical protein